MAPPQLSANQSVGQALIGQQFGWLTVIGLSRRPMCRGWQCECLCKCGKKTLVRPSCLRNRKTVSCGCNFIFRVKERHKANPSKRRIDGHESWSHMIKRCYSPKCPDYKRYGARGIAVCERWRRSFHDFISDMGPRPSATHSIDRYPDNNGNYEPGNCRWATPIEQSNNRRSTVYVTIDGTTKPLTSWCRELGIKYGRVASRVRIGWDHASAIVAIVNKTPKRKRSR